MPKFDRADLALVGRLAVSGLVVGAGVLWGAFVLAIAARSAWQILTGGGC